MVAGLAWNVVDLGPAVANNPAGGRSLDLLFRRCGFFSSGLFNYCLFGRLFRRAGNHAGTV